MGKFIEYKNGIIDLIKINFDIINIASLDKYDISVSTFENLSNWNNFTINWQNIDNELSISWLDKLDDEIFEILIDNFFSSNVSILIINDDFIKVKKIPLIQAENLRKFIENYEEKFNSTFFQPQDLIISSKDFKNIFLLHHDGFYAKIIR